MNRRKFLSWLGVGAAVAAVAPYASTVMGPECVAIDPILGVAVPAGAVIGEYADYTNFSEFAVSEHLDAIVANAAKQLGEAAGREITAMQLRAFA